MSVRRRSIAALFLLGAGVPSACSSFGADSPSAPDAGATDAGATDANADQGNADTFCKSHIGVFQFCDDFEVGELGEGGWTGPNREGKGDMDLTSTSSAHGGMRSLLAIAPTTTRTAIAQLTRREKGLTESIYLELDLKVVAVAKVGGEIFAVIDFHPKSSTPLAIGIANGKVYAAHNNHQYAGSAKDIVFGEWTHIVVDVTLGTYKVHVTQGEGSTAENAVTTVLEGGSYEDGMRLDVGIYSGAPDDSDGEARLLIDNVGLKVQ